MRAECNFGSLNGELNIPPSKSMMQRVCAAALLNIGTTVIKNPGISDDDKAALQLVQQLGATVTYEEGVVSITSQGVFPTTNELYCGESGLAARLFIPIAAISSNQLTVTGSGSLLNRPFNVYNEVLPKLGVTIESTNGHLPITLQGPLQPTDISFDGSLSSQFLSGLLFAFAFNAIKPCTITVTNLQSKPYIDMTLSVLSIFGKNITHNNYETFYINPQSFTNIAAPEITIEGDWSSASAMLVGAAVSGDVIINGLSEHSLQSDKDMLDVLFQAGAHLTLGETWVQVSHSGELNEFDFDATHAPDLFPMLSVLAACCNGESSIKGIHRLIHKESNRIESISEMLDKLGVIYSVADDTLFIEGKEILDSCTIDSYNDHRIVMAAAIAALRCDGKITIINAETVSKSYPDFFSHLYALGANCQLKD
jgi:3-phosphoshikimate 1-carboxyvinyltransferase